MYNKRKPISASTARPINTDAVEAGLAETVCWQPADYLPVEYIFNLLSYLRQDHSGNITRLSSHLKKRKLRSLADVAPEEQPSLPRVDFWLRLCHAASLLDDLKHPSPTILARHWLGWPPGRQLWHLVRAWCKIPRNEDEQNIRKRYIDHLRSGVSLAPSQNSRITGLRILGICTGMSLTSLGLACTGNRPPLYLRSMPNKPWQPVEGGFQVPFPPCWELLWKLENYLPAGEDGFYAFTGGVVDYQVRQESLPVKTTLEEIVKQGFGGVIPLEMQAAFWEEPVLSIVPGVTLEFINPNILARLRKSGKYTAELERVLSTRHVAVEHWQIRKLLRKFLNDQILSEYAYHSLASSLRFIEEQQLSADINPADRAYLFSQVKLVELMQLSSPPYGLLEKLTSGVDADLLTAGLREAQSKLVVKREPASGENKNVLSHQPIESMLNVIRSAITNEDILDVSYQSDASHQPEYRRIQPLLLEERWGRIYLLAYCHKRKANRTFRLDRLRLSDIGMVGDNFGPG